MATLGEQEDRGCVTGCQKCAPGPPGAQVAQAQKADSQPPTEEGAGPEGVTPPRREKANLAPSQVCHRGAVSFNAPAQQPAHAGQALKHDKPQSRGRPGGAPGSPGSG